MFFTKIEHKSSYNTFLNILHMDTLDMSGHFHESDNVSLEKLWYLSACKKWTLFLTSFWGILKILQTCYFK